MNKSFPDGIIFIQSPENQTDINQIEEQMDEGIEWIKKVEKGHATQQAILCKSL